MPSQNLLLSMLENPQFGGPADIRVAIDKGPDGPRGTFILLSDGDPNSPSTTIVNSFPNQNGGGLNLATIQRFDICFPLNPFDPSYLRVFIYQDGPQGLRWYPAVRLAPEGFPGILDATFNSGIASIFAAAALPLEVAQELAQASLQPMFDLDTYLNILATQISGILNINFNIINESPIAASVIPDPLFPAPVSVTYLDPSVSQYSAIIQNGSREVVLASGNTTSLNVGQKLFKQSGAGNFGIDPIITSILSERRFTVSADHLDSGMIEFAASSATVALNYALLATEVQEVENVGLVWLPLEGEKKVHVLIALAIP